MKILLTGGGTGGHFYPLIAVAEALEEVADREKIVDLKLYFMSDKPYDEKILYDLGITYVPITAGKKRLYSSVHNFFDIFKMGWGIFVAFFKVFAIYPDVIFCKGGYPAFPAVFVARVLRIPVVVHESDMSAGRVNIWAGKFAKRIAVSWSEAADDFVKKDRVAHTGHPIRLAVKTPASRGAEEFLGLESGVPTIAIFGGSQGARAINETIIDALPELLHRYQIIHQVGEKNIGDIKAEISFALKDHPQSGRYHAFGFLDALATRMIAGVAKLIITRAGSMLFEIAHWHIPAIVVPIPHSNGNHQHKNAFTYAGAGCGMVIEENNFTPHVLVEEIDRLLRDRTRYDAMVEATKKFSELDGAQMIAEEILKIARKHV